MLVRCEYLYSIVDYNYEYGHDFRFFTDSQVDSDGMMRVEALSIRQEMHRWHRVSVKNTCGDGGNILFERAFR